ncbi:MAG: hypothetical protein FWD57_07930, partial [Polyangiaceae bacterium]|nr:hypothetical protein [Polyangiaceae bacterium]
MKRRGLKLNAALVGSLIVCLSACDASNNGVFGGGGGGGGTQEDGDVQKDGNPDTVDGDSGGGFDQSFYRIVVVPLEDTVKLDLNKSAKKTYKATGMFIGAADQDISDQVVWSHSNEEVGHFDGSELVLAPMSTAGARTTIVRATLEDKIGEAQLTVVAFRQSGPQLDFFFELKHNDPNGPETQPLEFATDIPAMDVVFNMDTTGSMSGAITN